MFRDPSTKAIYDTLLKIIFWIFSPGFLKTMQKQPWLFNAFYGTILTFPYFSQILESRYFVDKDGK